MIGLIPFSVFAEELDKKQLKRLNSALGKFEKAFKKENYEDITELYPELFISTKALNLRVDDRQMRQIMAAQLNAERQKSAALGFGVDKESATYGMTPLARPYALVPFRTSLDVDGNRVEKRETLIWLVEDKKWRLLQLGTAQDQAIWRAAYPDMKAIDVPYTTFQYFE